MFAYDSRRGGGPFEALVDDVKLESPSMGKSWRIDADPPGGSCRLGTRVTLSAAAGFIIRYTLDGTNPTPESRHYAAPIRLDRHGIQEVRYAVQWDTGKLCPLVFGQLYTVR